MKEKPAYCTVSHNRGLWTISYYAHDHYTSISHQGYGPEVFKGVPKNTPVIRCDLATLDDVWKSLQGIETGCVEVHGQGCLGIPRRTLAEMLAHHVACGIPVQTIGTMTAD